MSKRVEELFLFDIVVSILKIKYIINKFDSPIDLKYDFIHWDSVIREYEIIGEATNNLLKSDILDKKHRVVVDFRNVLIHAYFGISEDEVWDISQSFLDEYLELILLKIDKNRDLVDEIIRENSHLPFVIEFLSKHFN